MTCDPLATDDVITVGIPSELATAFIEHESSIPPDKREYTTLRFGDHELGYWRIDRIASEIDDICSRTVATLRRVLP